MKASSAQRQFKRQQAKRKLTAQAKQQEKFDAATERMIRRFKKR